MEQRYRLKLSTWISKKLGAWSIQTFHERMSAELSKALGDQVIGNEDYEWMMDFIATDCMDNAPIDMQKQIELLARFVAFNEEGYFDDIQIIDVETGEHKTIDKSIFGRENPYLA